MTEDEYKEIRLSLDYHESRVIKIQKKIDSQLSKQEQFQIELAEIDKKVSVLDCVLDHQHLLREVANWQNRRSRTIDRISKTLKERTELLQLRESLNQKWKELTNDQQELCGPLCLKTDGKIYFI